MKNLIFATSILLISFLSLTYTGGISAQQRSIYAGQEKREIKSLSETDIQQLKSGKGWGLAKAAELNGVPGPVHLIEMKDKIGLSKVQLAQIEKLYFDMKNKAIPLGIKLIDLEKELNIAFASNDIDEKSLDEQLEKIAKVTKELRFVHLAAHLKSRSVLSAEQVGVYNNLRGYESNDPCANVPEGHDPALWKKHNNCK